MPLPVLAETVSSGTSFSCARPSSSAALIPLNRDEAFSATSHLLSAMISAAALLDHLRRRSCRSCDFEAAGGVEQQHDDFGIIDRAAGVGGRQPLELVLDLGALAQARGVDQAHRPAVPFPVEADRIARDPGFGAGDHPLLAEHAVDQGRLAGVGPADDRELERRAVARPRRLRPRNRSCSTCGRSASNRSATPSPCSALSAIGSPRPSAIGFETPGFAAAPFGLVGDDDHRRRLGAQPAADFLVERGQALARVDQEQGGVGLAHRGLGLLRASGRAGCAGPRPRTRRCRSPGSRARAGSPRPRAGRGSRPGRSSTSARRLPTSRLNRVDLPTLGRPTMATVGRGMAAPIAAPSPRCGVALAEGVQPAVVVEDVERRIGDDRRQADRRRRRWSGSGSCRSPDRR